MIAPEGIVHNGRHVLKYKTSAFVAGIPLLPVRAHKFMLLQFALYSWHDCEMFLHKQTGTCACALVVCRRRFASHIRRSL